MKYSPFVYNDQTRKTIQLANYDSLSGMTTQGVGVNLAMVSQWDKADFGSMQVTMNLNSKDGIVQLNDEKVLATVDQIPDVSVYATAAALTEGLAGKQDKGDYALKSEIPTVPTALPNPNALTIKYNGQVAFTYDGSKAETGNFIVNGETVPVTADNAQTLKAYIDAGLAEKQAAGDYALKSDVPSVEGLATDESVDQKIAEAQAATGIVDLGEFSQAIVAENKAAEAGIFDTAENRVLVYTVNGQSGYIVNNVQADQTTQFLTWNGKQYVRSVTASGASAWTALNAVKLQGKAIVGPKFFALTTESASDDIKAAMTSGTDNLITEDDLNECLKKGYLIDEYSMQSGSIIVGFNGQGFTFTYVGFPNPVRAPSLMTCVVSITDGVYKVLQNATKGTIVTSANLASYVKTDATVTGLTAQVEQLNTALEGKQDKGDYATSEVVQAEFESYDKTNKTYIEQQVTPKADQVEVDSLDLRVNVVESISGNIYMMQSQIAQLMDQVQQLKTPTVEPVEISAEQPSVDQPDQDVSFNATVNGTVGTITAKSIQSTNASIQSGRLAATATNDVSIKNLSTSGDLAKSTANAGLSVNTNEYVTITGADWQQTGYNGIEVGLSSAPKSVLIDNVDFKSTMSNNAISIFSWQENAVITISNCHFANVSNPLRLSNRDNKQCTVNIVNCTCDQWVAGEYAGFICMQDYTSSSAQAAQEANQFGKLTINFVNCSGPDGRIVGNAQQLAENHIIYVYTDQEGLIAFGDGSRYPTVTAQ